MGASSALYAFPAASHHRDADLRRPSPPVLFPRARLERLLVSGCPGVRGGACVGEGGVAQPRRELVSLGRAETPEASGGRPEAGGRGQEVRRGGGF